MNDNEVTEKIRDHKNIKKHRKIYIELNVRIGVLIIASILFALLCIIFFLIGANEVTENSFFYSENGNLEYKVCLKENEYFKDRCLGKNRHYIASLIDNIETEFKYSFNTSDFFNYNYTYYVTARLIATKKNSPTEILYNEVEKLIGEKSVDMVDSNAFLINQKVIIDYSKYNDIIAKFKENYSVVADGKLIVSLHIKLNGDYKNIDEEIIVNQDISLLIPLSKETINIAVDDQDLNNSEKFTNKSNNTALNLMFYFFSCLCLIASIFTLIKLFKLISKTKVRKSLYEKRLDKIMSKYDSIITIVKEVPDLSGMKIYKIESFEELLDAQNILQKPILYVKIHNEKSCFLVNYDNECYRFIMKAIDLDKSK